jgi:hypothetical protein
MKYPSKATACGTCGETFDYDLHILSREEIISSLIQPSNAALSKTFFNISPTPDELQVEQLMEQTRTGILETIEDWFNHARLAGWSVPPRQLLSV